MSAAFPAYPAYPILAYAAMNALGTTTRDVIANLHAGRSGLGACPLELPFETPTGAVPEPLPALPASLSAWDSRTARLAVAGLDEDALAQLPTPASSPET